MAGPKERTREKIVGSGNSAWAGSGRGIITILWLKNENLEDPNPLPEPQLLIADAITELSACVDDLQLIMDEIEAEEIE